MPLCGHALGTHCGTSTPDSAHCMMLLDFLDRGRRHTRSGTEDRPGIISTEDGGLEQARRDSQHGQRGEEHCIRNTESHEGNSPGMGSPAVPTLDPRAGGIGPRYRRSVSRIARSAAGTPTQRRAARSVQNPPARAPHHARGCGQHASPPSTPAMKSDGTALSEYLKVGQLIKLWAAEATRHPKHCSPPPTLTNAMGLVPNNYGRARPRPTAVALGTGAWPRRNE
ncbi:hypothetical protein TcBrA4_0084890 [Trypanosoma cruzi]|nr:hypothetical protein TcBrA4_0084890 [Trypanosoma cruzi]